MSVFYCFTNNEVIYNLKRKRQAYDEQRGFFNRFTTMYKILCNKRMSVSSDRGRSNSRVLDLSEALRDKDSYQTTCTDLSGNLYGGWLASCNNQNSPNMNRNEHEGTEGPPDQIIENRDLSRQDKKKRMKDLQRELRQTQSEQVHVEKPKKPKTILCKNSTTSSGQNTVSTNTQTSHNSSLTKRGNSQLSKRSENMKLETSLEEEKSEEGRQTREREDPDDNERLNMNLHNRSSEHKCPIIRLGTSPQQRNKRTSSSSYAEEDHTTNLNNKWTTNNRNPNHSGISKSESLFTNSKDRYITYDQPGQEMLEEEDADENLKLIHFNSSCRLPGGYQYTNNEFEPLHNSRDLLNPNPTPNHHDPVSKKTSTDSGIGNSFSINYINQMYMHPASKTNNKQSRLLDPSRTGLGLDEHDRIRHSSEGLPVNSSKKSSCNKQRICTSGSDGSYQTYFERK